MASQGATSAAASEAAATCGIELGGGGALADERVRARRQLVLECYYDEPRTE